MAAVVFGCGAWGTTLAALIAEKEKEVYLVCHEQKICDEINNFHTNLTYLPKEPKLSPNIKAVLDYDISIARIIVVAVASQYYRQTLQKLRNISGEQLVLSATKGMEDISYKSILEIAEEELDDKIYKKNYAILSGPNLANEIFIGKPAASVVACKNVELASFFAILLSSEHFRVYTSQDTLGVEYGGILKNVIAIAAGILDAMDLGANAKSALLVRGMAEIKRFAVSEGAKEETILGLSGFGDLITTCLGPASRNYTVGYRIGKGEKIDDILASMVAVAEGVNSAKVIFALAKKKKISMPITECVYQVLYEDLSVKKAIQSLMQRELKKED